jgi:hypothetical protein
MCICWFRCLKLREFVAFHKRVNKIKLKKCNVLRRKFRDEKAWGGEGGSWRTQTEKRFYLLLLLLLLLLFIFFMQGIYNCIPEMNQVSRVHNIAAILYLQFVLHAMLFRTCSMYFTITSVHSAVCVQCPIQLLSVVP